MIAAVVEGAIGDEDVGGRSSLFFILGLLGAQHDEGQLARRLPDLVFFHDLLGVSWGILGALVVAGFGLLYIVDLISIVVRAAVHGLVLFIAFYNGSICHYVEACLGLGD